MSRYIDADALIDLSISVLCGGGNEEMAVLVEDIEATPSIEIIRCRECRWGKPYSDKQLECDALGLGGLKFPDDFCSYGEKR